MKKLITLIIAILLIAIFESVNNIDTDEKTQTVEEIQEIVFSDNAIDKDINKIAFISDLHLQLGEVKDGISYIDSLNSYLIDAAFDDVNNNEIDLLVICGDNANSGKLNEHQELINKLKVIKPEIEILVINGNHDISSSVDPKKFENLYSDLGYNKALSKDYYSLSYSALYNNLMLVMLDSKGYDDYTCNPKVSDDTLSWLKAQLEYAKENNVNLITVSHYPIVGFTGSEFENVDKLIELLDFYDVPLIVSGHLHYHKVNIYKDIKELVVEQVTAYPVSYEVLEIEDNIYKIHDHKLDVNTYAKNYDIYDPKLLNFDEHLESQFKKKCDDIVDILVGDKYYKTTDKDKAKEVFYMTMKYRTDGSLIDYKDEILNHEGYKIFLKIADGTIWAKWIPVVLDDANEFTKGFEIDLNERN